MLTRNTFACFQFCSILFATFVGDSAAGGATHLRRYVLAEDHSTELLDLSQPFVQDALSNNNTCAKNIIGLASKEPEIRGLIVLEHGKIVAEYYDDDVNERTRSPIWSCTKAWTYLLLGILEKDNLLSINETLGDIFSYDPYDSIWGNVPDADARKALTVKSIITMTAGLSMPDDWLFDALLGAFHKGFLGGSDFMDSLTYHKLDKSKTDTSHEYVSAGNILSYVIKERTRMTPQEFARRKVFPFLGISEKDYRWQSNADDMSYSWHGLFMTVRAMAKLGMLYLQRGRASQDISVVDESFILDSTQGTEINKYYGYHWINDAASYPEHPSRYCTIGFGDNLICVDENLERVFAITSNNYIPDLAGGEIDQSSWALAHMVADPDCSFKDPF